MSTISTDVPSVHDQYTDAAVAFQGVPDDAAAEMAQHFGYDQQPTDDELITMHADWQRREAIRVSFANLEPLPELHPIRRAVAKLNPALWPQLKSA